jgi:hypothetical protein
LSIDSENYLFDLLKNEYEKDFPNIINRRSYNDRKKVLDVLTDKIRTRMSDKIEILVYRFKVIRLEVSHRNNQTQLCPVDKYSGRIRNRDRVFTVIRPIHVH